MTRIQHVRSAAIMPPPTAANGDSGKEDGNWRKHPIREEHAKRETAGDSRNSATSENEHVASRRPEVCTNFVWVLAKTEHHVPTKALPRHQKPVMSGTFPTLVFMEKLRGRGALRPRLDAGFPWRMGRLVLAGASGDGARHLRGKAVAEGAQKAAQGPRRSQSAAEERHRHGTAAKPIVPWNHCCKIASL
jgi:hypothetical protein